MTSEANVSELLHTKRRGNKYVVPLFGKAATRFEQCAFLA